MNKLKSAAGAFRNYLDKDIRGVKLLDAVVREANDIRKSLSKEKEDREIDRKHHAATKEKIAALEMKIKSMKEDLEKEKSRTIDARQRVKDLLLILAKKDAELDKLRPPDEVPPQIERVHRADFVNNKETIGVKKAKKITQEAIDSYTKAFNWIRREMTVAPEPIHSPPIDSERLMCYELNDICDFFSPRGMMRLGYFIYCLVFMGIDVVITTEVNLKSCSCSLTTKQLSRFVRWYRKSSDFRRDHEFIVEDEDGNFKVDKTRCGGGFSK